MIATEDTKFWGASRQGSQFLMKKMTSEVESWREVPCCRDSGVLVSVIELKQSGCRLQSIFGRHDSVNQERRYKLAKFSRTRFIGIDHITRRRPRSYLRTGYTEKSLSVLGQDQAGIIRR